MRVCIDCALHPFWAGTQHCGPVLSYYLSTVFNFEVYYRCLKGRDRWGDNWWYSSSIPDFYDKVKVLNEDEELPSGDIYIYAEVPKDERMGRFYESLRKHYKVRIYWCLDCWEGWEYGLGGTEFHGKVYQNETFVMNHSDIILAVSRPLCEYLQRRAMGRVFLFRNFVYAGLFTPPRLPKRKVAVSIGWGGGHGTMTRRKLKLYRDFEKLELLLKEFPDWHFYIFGSSYEPLPFLTKGVSLIEGCVPFREVKWALGAARIGLVLNSFSWFSYYADPQRWYLYNNAGLVVVSQGIRAHRNSDEYPYTVCVGLGERGEDPLVAAFRKAVELSEKVSDPWMEIPQPFSTLEYRIQEFFSIISPWF